MKTPCFWWLTLPLYKVNRGYRAIEAIRVNEPIHVAFRWFMPHGICHPAQPMSNGSQLPEFPISTGGIRHGRPREIGKFFSSEAQRALASLFKKFLVPKPYMGVRRAPRIM